MPMTQHRQLAASLIGLLFVYYEIFRWLPLGRWNGQFSFPVTNDQFYPDLVIGALLIWFTWSFAKSRRAGMITGCILLTLWTVLHFFDWWLPYFRNLPQNVGRYSFYQPHTQILPVMGHHYPPDAGHTVLDFILYPTTIFALFSIARSRPAN